jgi:hypothetical protein
VMAFEIVFAAIAFPFLVFVSFASAPWPK